MSLLQGVRSIANITPVVQVGTVKVPGPGEYDLREETVPKTGVKGFGQVFRFPTKQIFFGENFKNVPGPCRYRKDHDSMRKATTRKRRSIKPNRSFGSSSTRAGHNRYAVAKKNCSNTPVKYIQHKYSSQLSYQASVQFQSWSGRVL